MKHGYMADSFFSAENLAQFEAMLKQELCQVK